MLVRIVIFHLYTKFEVRRPCHSKDMTHDVSELMVLVTLTFDSLTLKLVCESHLRFRTFLPNLGTLGLWFSNYLLCTRPTDRWTDGRTDKRNAYCPIYEDEGVIILDAYVVNAELSDNARSWRISTISETGTFEPQYKGTGGPGSLGSALVTSYSYPS